MEKDPVVRSIEQCRGKMKNRGWSVLPAEANDEGRAATFSRTGRTPQPDGREAFEGGYQAGYDDRPCGQRLKRLQDDRQAGRCGPLSTYPALHAHRSSPGDRIHRLDFS
jgi:hypothetical protein